MTTPEEHGAAVPGPRVREAMISDPKTMAHDATLGAAQAALADSHVHLLLLVRDGVLLGTIDRDDLTGVDAPATTPALERATLHGRTTGPDADAGQLRHDLHDARARRLAVVDDDGRLLGLLCLKRTGSGFCSDADVAARAADHRDPTAVPADRPA